MDFRKTKDFESHYFYEFYADEMMVARQPFQYQIQAVSSGYALLVTNSLGYEAYYNSFILSTLDGINIQISIAFQNDDLIFSGLNSKPKTISVYDLNGKLFLYTTTTENRIKTDLKNGIYILKIEENGKIIKTMKLMKK